LFWTPVRPHKQDPKLLSRGLSKNCSSSITVIWMMARAPAVVKDCDNKTAQKQMCVQMG
ncbi:hypothetical protein JOB18_018813, partial [Solea senegalensis]